MTSDLEVTINSLAESMDLHANKLTAAVNSLSSASPNNLGKFVKTQNILKIQNWGSQQSPNYS